ncbi:MAG: Ig-like domain-containing protein, partial [Candidatus Limnocylindrales bacterium]
AVATGTDVTATFSEAVTGVSGTTFTLEGPGATPIGASVTYDGPSRTATLDPTTSLAPNTSYTARLSSGITDLATNPLAPLDWTFTTGAAPSGPAFRGATSAANVTATTLVLPRPAATVAGDVLLANIAARGNPSFSGPAGWTLVRVDISGSTVRQAVFVHVAGGSEPASYTFTMTKSESAAGGIVAYSGVDTANPIDVHGGQTNASSTSMTAPSITTTGPNRLLVAFFGTATLTSQIAPAGMTERFDEAVPSSNKYKVTAGAHDELLAGAGSTGSRVALSANSSINIGQLVALNPGGSPPVDTTAPTVTDRVPASGATDVAVGTNVTATFSEDVTGVSGTTFTLEGPGPTAVTATVSYNAGTRVATLDPSASLAAGTTYTARLTSGITDLATNPLAPVSWTFTTAEPPPPGSGIAFRSASSADNTTATSLVIPAPSGVVTGDALLASVSVRGNPTITPPSGWTLVRLDINANTMRQAVFVRSAGGSEPTSYTFALSNAQSASGGIVAYSGVDGVSPIDADGGQVNPASTSITAPSITTTGADRMLVGFFGTPTLTSMVAPAGMTERFDEAVPSTNQYKVTGAAADAGIAAAGATGSRVALAANSAANIGQLIALRPAP